MILKYFCLIIGLSILVNVKCQSQDDDYDDYDAEQPPRTGS